MGVSQAEQLALCGRLYRRSHRRRQPATVRLMPAPQNLKLRTGAVVKKVVMSLCIF